MWYDCKSDISQKKKRPSDTEINNYSSSYGLQPKSTIKGLEMTIYTRIKREN